VYCPVRTVGPEEFRFAEKSVKGMMVAAIGELVVAVASYAEIRKWPRILRVWACVR
jgi:hypothetical protein